MSSPLIEVEHLVQGFAARPALGRRRAGLVRAVDDVTLRLARDETVGLVGESGCGKTTLVRTMARLLEPTGGTIRLDGRDITRASARELRPLRKRMQVVFQDPLGALNPRRRVIASVASPLRVHGTGRTEAAERAAGLLDRVGLGPELHARYPHELSGGERQRVGIARALALEPELLLLDEPVSALDVSIRAQILNLLGELREDLGLSYLLVAHDLAVVRHASDRVAVMYLGKLVELAAAPELFGRALHPYTAALLDAVPVPDPRRRARGGGDRSVRARPGGDRSPADAEPASAEPADAAPACVFRERCPRATGICSREEPALMRYPGGRLAACHHPLGMGADELRAAERAPESPLSSGHSRPTA